jgi:hypothetical protein
VEALGQLAPELEVCSAGGDLLLALALLAAHVVPVDPVALLAVARVEAGVRRPR